MLKETTNYYWNHQEMISTVKLIILKYWAGLKITYINQFDSSFSNANKGNEKAPGSQAKVFRLNNAVFHDFTSEDFII